MAKRRLFNAPSFGDQLKGAGRAIRSEGLAGAASPMAIMKHAKQVRDERQAYEEAEGDKYYSKWDEAKKGRIDLFVDRNGNPTTGYPHVHVIHTDSAGGVRVVASTSKGAQVFHETLPATASGREVEALVARARSRI